MEKRQQQRSFNPLSSSSSSSSSLTHSEGKTKEFVLHITAKFQFSRIKPFKDQLYKLIQEKRIIENNIAEATTGGGGRL
jgi:hypothetical protein